MDRRTLFRGVSVIALTAGLGGCSKQRVQEHPLPDVAVLSATIAAEEHLVALYEAVQSTHLGLARRLSPFLAHHRDHLSTLRRHYRPGTGPATPSPLPPTPPRPTAPALPAQALAALRLAERRAAAARIQDVGRVGPGFAQLLASIGTCEAGHATALARVGTAGR